MNLVVDFLLEYYVWVLVVLVILIITVIGFLVDTKRKKKLREKNDNNLSQTGQPIGANNTNGMIQNTNMMDPMMNQSMNNLDGFNDAMFNPNPPSLETNIGQGINGFDPMINQNINNNLTNNMMNQNNIPMQNTVAPQSQNNRENINAASVQNQTVSNNLINSNNQMESNVLTQNNNETFFVPISQQSPVFEPKEVVIPKQVETAPLMSSTPTPVIEPVPVQAAVPNANQLPNQNINMVNGGVGNIPNTIVNPANQMPNGQSNTIAQTNNIASGFSIPQMSDPTVNQTMSTVEPVVQNIAPTIQMPAPEPVVMPSQSPNMQINNPVMTNAVNPLPVNEGTVLQTQNIPQNPVNLGQQSVVTMPEQNISPVMNVPTNQPINSAIMGQPINNENQTGNDNWSL